MTSKNVAEDSPASWAERAADRSPSVQRSRSRSIQQAKQIVDAARRLIDEKGDQFTTQELAKEAGIALQTLYRYFSGKDQLLLAVMEDLLAEGNANFIDGARNLKDPISRLHYYVTHAVRGEGAQLGSPSAKFITAQHWYLYQLFPAEMSKPSPFTRLVAAELRLAQEHGLLEPFDVDQAAWFISKLVTAVFHHHAFAPPGDVDPAALAEQVWDFCLNGLRGSAPVPVAPNGTRAASARTRKKQ